jgi:hypothetical protein
MLSSPEQERGFKERLVKCLKSMLSSPEQERAAGFPSHYTSTDQPAIIKRLQDVATPAAALSPLLAML